MSENQNPAVVTPTNPQHSLFGKALAFVKEEGEFIYAEIKDGIHWVEARFEKSEVRPVTEENPLPVQVETTAVVSAPAAPVAVPGARAALGTDPTVSVPANVPHPTTPA